MVRVAAALCVLLLSACASTPASRLLLPSDAQETLLRGLDEFSLNGRVAVRAGDEAPPTASISWRQHDQQTVLRLSGPMGSGRLNVTWSPDSLRLANSRGQVFENAEAEQILIRELGFVPPFDALRHWVLGLEAPGEAVTQRELAQSGRIGEMQQLQWRIRYDRWKAVRAGKAAVEMPGRVIVTRGDLRLSVAIRKWKL